MSGISTANDLQRRVQACREQKFTGILTIEGQSADGRQARWTICFLLGQITWTQSRLHSLRRWIRSFKLYSPDLFSQISRQKDISQKAWNYTSLAQLVKLKKLSENKLTNIIESVVTEDLFDILQTGTYLQTLNEKPLTYKRIEKPLTIMPAVIINHERAWQEVQKQWSDWSNAGLANCSPDWGLEIMDLEALRLRTSPQTLQILQTCCDSTSTLRDIAIKLRQPPLVLAQSMRPYFSEGLIGFSEISNLVEDIDHGFSLKLFAYESLVRSPVARPMPATDRSALRRNGTVPAQSNRLIAKGSAALANSPTVGKRAVNGSLVNGSAVSKASASTLTRRASTRGSLTNSSAANTARREVSPHSSNGESNGDRVTPLGRKPKSAPLIDAPLVVYIDDSPADSRAMAEVVENRGYRYSNVADPIQALPVLLEIKPDLIFLDLVMPIANGYEVCAQIRRISAFKQTPIIIVTSNDGVADRVRAKIVGASGFMGKPIQDKKVAKVLKKHLPSPPARHHEPADKSMVERPAYSSAAAVRPTEDGIGDGIEPTTQKSDRLEPEKQSLIGRLRRFLFS